MLYDEFINQLEKDFDEFEYLELIDFDSKIEIINRLDKIFKKINIIKSNNSTKMFEVIKSSKIPNKIEQKNITLFSLLLYFQKKYVFQNFVLYFNFDSFQKEILRKEIKIKSKLSNFPHLIGVRGERNLSGEIISKSQPKKFLDGVLHQSILINSFDDYIIDFEKLEVFSWIWQTLVTPTYIINKDEINQMYTKLNADIIFIKRVYNSKKYSFHIVALRNEMDNDFSIISQFGIKKECFCRIGRMFNIENASYNFYKSEIKSPISPRKASLI